MKRTLLLIFCFLAVTSYAQEIPKNAHKNTYGIGWECDRGYYRSGNNCVPVQIPENAQLNYYGHGWECKRGFYKSGNRCLPVQIPKNGQLNYYGHGWECKRGFYKSGNNCVPVQIPENAQLNYYGHGWECKQGFYKSGNRCLPVQIPKNGQLNYYGHGWECKQGYKKHNNECIAMTKEDIQTQRHLEQALLKEIQRRKVQGVYGDDCETEYKTNAEVCVEITSGNLDCNESYAGNYYSDCDATIYYDIETDYQGGSYLDVEVECRLEIEYKGRNTYITQSDSSYQDNSHSLYAYGNESDSMSFNFSFSSFNEITSVEISSAECEIDSVELY